MQFAERSNVLRFKFPLRESPAKKAELFKIFLKTAPQLFFTLNLWNNTHTATYEYVTDQN